MNARYGVFACLLIAALQVSAATEPPSQRQPAPTAPLPVPAPAPYVSKTVLSTINSVELYMKNASAGTIVRFNIGGRHGNIDAKCVVLVTFERAPSAVHPQPASIEKEYTLPMAIPTMLETVSTNQGGDWTFRLKPVRECTGKEYVFNFKVLFGNAELAPVIYGVGVSPQPLWVGNSGQINILGGDDLKNCKVELFAGALVIAGPFTGNSTKIISMNGQTAHSEPFNLPLPPNYQKKFTTYPANVWVKAVSGCTVKAPDSEGKNTQSFSVWY